jgi:hypothetical protein
VPKILSEQKEPSVDAGKPDREPFEFVVLDLKGAKGDATMPTNTAVGS